MDRCVSPFSPSLTITLHPHHTQPPTFVVVFDYFRKLLAPQLDRFVHCLGDHIIRLQRLGLGLRLRLRLAKLPWHLVPGGFRMRGGIRLLSSIQLSGVPAGSRSTSTLQTLFFPKFASSPGILCWLRAGTFCVRVYSSPRATPWLPLSNCRCPHYIHKHNININTNKQQQQQQQQQ